MSWASKRIATTTGRLSTRWPPSPLVKEYPLTTSNIHRSLSVNQIGGCNNIARRTVHIEQHFSKKDEDIALDTDATGENPREKPTRSRSRRTRTKRFSLDDEKVPSYKEFVHRFTVLSLYRGYLKCIRDSMPHNQQDLRKQVRREFRLNMHDNDPFAIKRNITEGQRQFQELQEFTGRSNKYKGESWINIQDPEDPRGRVGTGWPWAK